MKLIVSTAGITATTVGTGYTPITRVQGGTVITPVSQTIVADHPIAGSAAAAANAFDAVALINFPTGVSATSNIYAAVQSNCAATTGLCSVTASANIVKTTDNMSAPANNNPALNSFYVFDITDTSSTYVYNSADTSINANFDYAGATGGNAAAYTVNSQNDSLLVGVSPYCTPSSEYRRCRCSPDRWQ